ncbi:unnamed protein product, partial [Aphanomyces euteiches]
SNPSLTPSQLHPRLCRMLNQSKPSRLPSLLSNRWRNQLWTLPWTPSKHRRLPKPLWNQVRRKWWRRPSQRSRWKLLWWNHQWKPPRTWCLNPPRLSQKLLWKPPRPSQLKMQLQWKLPSKRQSSQLWTLSWKQNRWSSQLWTLSWTPSKYRCLSCI